jgi:hypothetical protein
MDTHYQTLSIKIRQDLAYTGGIWVRWRQDFLHILENVGTPQVPVPPLKQNTKHFTLKCGAPALIKSGTHFLGAHEIRSEMENIRRMKYFACRLGARLTRVG